MNRPLCLIAALALPWAAASVLGAQSPGAPRSLEVLGQAAGWSAEAIKALKVGRRLEELATEPGGLVYASRGPWAAWLNASRPARAGNLVAETLSWLPAPGGAPGAVSGPGRAAASGTPPAASSTPPAASGTPPAASGTPPAASGTPPAAGPGSAPGSGAATAADPAFWRGLARRLSAVSRLSGLPYFSVSRGRWETFIETSVTVAGPGDRRPSPDFEPPAEGRGPWTFYSLQKDNRFGENLYRLRLEIHDQGLHFQMSNLTTLNWGLIPLVGPEDMHLRFSLWRLEDGLLLYSQSSAATGRFFGLEQSREESFFNRLAALTTWIGTQVEAQREQRR